MYLMTCTRPDLAYPLSILSRYVAPGRHRPEHMAAAKRVLRYLCSTSGMGLVLGGRSPVVLTGHADASWADDQATQRSCEAEIYAGAMAAQELRWLTYLLTDLGEPPRSPPVLYVDNKAMLALCREQRLEHRTKHIALRYFLDRELQQRGQLRLAYVASEANTADVFTKALAPCDHQRCCTQLGLLCFALLDWSCNGGSSVDDTDSRASNNASFSGIRISGGKQRSQLFANGSISVRRPASQAALFIVSDFWPSGGARCRSSQEDVSMRQVAGDCSAPIDFLAGDYTMRIACGRLIHHENRMRSHRLSSAFPEISHAINARDSGRRQPQVKARHRSRTAAQGACVQEQRSNLEQLGAAGVKGRRGAGVAEQRTEYAGATEQPGATWSSRREGKAWCRSGRAADRV
ncbi:unnamed protein product, partial [Closterium sp. NIES-53]